MAGGLGITERVALTTIEEWTKTVSEQTEKYLVLLALMKSKGKIKYKCSGGGFRWPVRIADHQLKDYTDRTPADMDPVLTLSNANLGWRGYYSNDSISLQEKYENGGPEAMIKVFANREQLMRDGLMRGLADEFYRDGNASGNERKFHGIESFMGIGAQTASSIIASTHDDSYASLSTAVNTVGGTAQPRVWTPTIINTNHTPSGGQKTWENYADEYLRTAFLRMTHGNGANNRPDLVILNRDAYEALLNLMDDKERINVSRGQGLALTKLGFGNNVEIDGVGVMWESACPTTDSDSADVRGYVFNCSRMELKVLGAKQLFTTRVTFNDTYRTDYIHTHLLGNLKFESPRHFGKLADISAVAS